MSRRASRKTPRPRSWLEAVRSASCGLTGSAQVVEEAEVDATATSFRGGGHRLTAEIAVVELLFGPGTEDPLRLQGDTPRPPEERVDVGSARFPPDTLRAIPYWDVARPGVATPVLVLVDEPPVVRALLGADDDLPEAVTRLRRWIELPPESRRDAVLADLHGNADPVSFAAGFELLAEDDPDLAGLFRAFVSLEGRDPAGVEAVVRLLRGRAGGLPESAVEPLATTLVEALQDEDEPEAVAAYLAWFDALGVPPELAQRVAVQAARARDLRVDRPGGAWWEQVVHEQADAVLAGLDAEG
jgi:hypothetical protein